MNWIKSESKLPKSGVAVIAYVQNAYGNGKTRRVSAIYATERTLKVTEDLDDYTDWEDEFDWDEETWILYYREGWYEQSEFGEVYNPIDGDVTHWMDMPSPPAKEGSLVVTQTGFVSVQDWDDLVTKTYGKPYSFQQQDECQPRGEVGLIVPDEAYDYENDTLPEIVNHEKMGVSFKAWKARDPKQPLSDDDNSWSVGMWWDRNFYPELQTVANDLHKRGLIEAGDYTIKIDW